MKNKLEKTELNVNEHLVGIMRINNVDYISLTDLARYKNPINPGDVIIKWMSNKNSFDFYCLWEELFNPNFNFAESREIKINEVGLNAFTMSPSRWISNTNAIKDIIVPSLTYENKKHVYADEADVLNVALFGMTAKEWKNNNPNLPGNIRDNADILHLIILSNLEVLNSELISQGINQQERIKRLNEIAIQQLNILYNENNVKLIADKKKQLIISTIFYLKILCLL